MLLFIDFYKPVTTLDSYRSLNNLVIFFLKVEGPYKAINPEYIFRYEVNFTLKTDFVVVNRICSKLEINYTPTYIFIEEVEYLKPHAETS